MFENLKLLYDSTVDKDRLYELQEAVSKKKNLKKLLDEKQEKLDDSILFHQMQLYKLKRCLKEIAYRADHIDSMYEFLKKIYIQTQRLASLTQFIEWDKIEKFYNLQSEENQKFNEEQIRHYKELAEQMEQRSIVREFRNLKQACENIEEFKENLRKELHVIEMRKDEKSAIETRNKLIVSIVTKVQKRKERFLTEPKKSEEVKEPEKESCDTIDFLKKFNQQSFEIFQKPVQTMHSAENLVDHQQQQLIHDPKMTASGDISKFSNNSVENPGQCIDITEYFEKTDNAVKLLKPSVKKPTDASFVDLNALLEKFNKVKDKLLRTIDDDVVSSIHPSSSLTASVSTLESAKQNSDPNSEKVKIISNVDIRPILSNMNVNPIKHVTIVSPVRSLSSVESVNQYRATSKAKHVKNSEHALDTFKKPHTFSYKTKHDKVTKEVTEDSLQATKMVAESDSDINIENALDKEVNQRPPNDAVEPRDVKDKINLIDSISPADSTLETLYDHRESLDRNASTDSPKKSGSFTGNDVCEFDFYENCDRRSENNDADFDFDMDMDSSQLMKSNKKNNIDDFL